MINLQVGLRHYIRKNLLFYGICSLALLVGLVIGSLNYRVMSSEENRYLAEYMNRFFSVLSSNMPNLSFIFKTAVIENGKLLLVMWIFGFSLIGIPICLFMIGVRGFAFGFAIGSFVGIYGWRGVLTALCALFPPMLLYLPALLTAGVYVMNYSLYFSSPGKAGLKEHLLSYFLWGLAIFLVFVIVALLEGYVSPMLIRLVSGLMVTA